MTDIGRRVEMLMGRKRKLITKKRRISTRQWFEYLEREITHLSSEIHTLRQLISILVEKHDRQQATTIAVNMENARLRMHMEKTDATPAPQA